MKPVNPKKPVLIAGAGLSGLACALTLQKKGIPYLLFDQSSRAGGRVKTDQTKEGFRLDRGFQVLLTSYPSLPDFLDLNELRLRPFSSGALIYGKDSSQLLANPFRHPNLIFKTLFSQIPTLFDKILVSRLVLEAQAFREMQNLKGQSTHDFLREYGFSHQFITQFWRPFLGGVTLDPRLSVDAHFFLFLLRCFSLGSVSVPALGMEEIPMQMFKSLDARSVRLSSPVATVQENQFILESGEVLSGGATVQTYETKRERYRSVITYYFAGSVEPNFKKWLVLIPPGLGFKLNHLAVMSAVSPDYAPPGQVLISASIIFSSQEPDEALSANSIRDELNEIAKKDLKLSHLRRDVIRHALPELTHSPKFIRDGDQYFCGDYLCHPSIEGALKSGKLTALEITKGLQASPI